MIVIMIMIEIQDKGIACKPNWYIKHFRNTCYNFALTVEMLALSSYVHTYVHIIICIIASVIINNAY